MTIEDVNKLSYLYEQYGKGRGITSDSIAEIPIGNPDALAAKHGFGYGRYAYYSYDTPDTEVKDVIIQKNGEEITYHGRKVYDNKFYTYDDNSGNTHTAKENNEGINGYRVPKNENGEINPVLVTYDYYTYQIPSEVVEIIGYNGSWLASVCVDPGWHDVRFEVRLVKNGIVDEQRLCYSNGSSNGATLGIHPVISLSTKLLEQSNISENDIVYNSWKLK